MSVTTVSPQRTRVELLGALACMASLNTLSLDHEEWTNTRFGVVPRLPKIDQAKGPAPGAEGATSDHGIDALPSDDHPRASRPGAVYVTRPKAKKVFVAGTPRPAIAAAVVREVGELRRARDEAHFQQDDASKESSSRGPAAALRSTPAPPVPPAPHAPPPHEAGRQAKVAGASARGPSPRRQAAARAASLQDSAAREIGLDPSEAPVASLPPAPASRLAFKHDEPQPQQSPHAAEYAFDAMDVGLAAPLGHDGWANRSTMRGSQAQQGLFSGNSALVMGELEVTLKDAGITAETLADAGLTTDEAKRVFNSLYVHSSGFHTMLVEACSHAPHRSHLLHKVWLAFAMLIERVAAHGHEDVSFASVLTKLHHETTASYDELKEQMEVATATLEADLESARNEAMQWRRSCAQQESNTASAESARAEVERARAELETALASSVAAHRKEEQARQHAERRIAEEEALSRPLRLQASQLAGAQAEAARAKTVAAKVAEERNTERRANAELQAAARSLDALNSVLLSALTDADGAIQGIARVVEDSQKGADSLEQEMADQKAAMEQIRKAEASRGEDHKEKTRALMSQLDEMHDLSKLEKEARAAAEGEAAQLKVVIDQLHRQAEADRGAIATLTARIDEVNSTVAERDHALQRMEEMVEAERRATQLASSQKEAALVEAKRAQDECRRLVEDLSSARKSTSAARAEADALKLSGSRDTEIIRAELREVTSARDVALAEMAEAKETNEAIQDRVEELEAELQKQRLLLAEREAAHQAHLAAHEQQARLEHRASHQAQLRAAQQEQEEAVLLKQSLEQVSDLQNAFAAMQQEVALLTADNECYALEAMAYEEGLACVYELRSTCDVALTTADAIAYAIREPVVEQMAMQVEQQRLIDATERDLGQLLGRLDDLTRAWSAEAQPAIDMAAHAVEQVPLLKAEMTRMGHVRSETLAKLAAVQDAADEERRRLTQELGLVSKQAAEHREHAAFTTNLQASQLEQVNRDLSAAMEELEGWRNGTIRRANAKNWDSSSGPHGDQKRAASPASLPQRVGISAEALRDQT